MKNKYSFLYKIKIRLNFLYIMPKKWPWLIWVFSSAEERMGECSFWLLHKLKQIDWNKKENFFVWKNIKIYYDQLFSPVLFDVFFTNYNLPKDILETDRSYETDYVYISKQDVVIDAGANIGLFSFLAAIKTSNKIYAFEPFSDAVSYIKKTKEVNNLNNINIIELALGKRNEEKTFLVTENSLERTACLGKEGKKKKVSVVKLDTWVKDNNILKIDFIKADIEGMERDFLQGAKETIKKFKPKLSLCTYHFPNDPEVLEKIILDINPKYNIFQNDKKIYAWV
jgi:FkbM family methyltransferase